jgi:hypothetical protein
MVQVFDAEKVYLHKNKVLTNLWTGIRHVAVSRIVGKTNAYDGNAIQDGDKRTVQFLFRQIRALSANVNRNKHSQLDTKGQRAVW